MAGCSSSVFHDSCLKGSSVFHDSCLRGSTGTATHLGCPRFIEGDVREAHALLWPSTAVCVGVLLDPGVLQALGHRQPVGGFMDQQGLRGFSQKGFFHRCVAEHQ